MQSSPQAQKSRGRQSRTPPRLAPPAPARTMIKDYERAADELGITLMPWQNVVGRYMTALGPKGNWLYRRVAVIVARQNGKTEIIKPRVLLGLRLGRAQLHIAQDRTRPRQSTFEPLVEFFDSAEHRRLYGVKQIRLGSGQERLVCYNGGSYTITAPTSGSARGGSYDDVYVDEVQEFEDDRVEAIIRPTTTARPNAQITYFGSAGTENAVVLNDIRRRKDDDPRMAYLEWSASPERGINDREGWAEANPALGITISIENLEDDFVSMIPNDFEREHMARWVISSQPRLLPEGIWERTRTEDAGDPQRPVMGVSLDPGGKRASAAIAWMRSDGSIGLRVEADVTGDPIKVDEVGPMLAKRAIKLGATSVSYDDWTDKDLARHFKNAKPCNGRDFAAASESFVRLVEAGRLRWDLADEVTTDLAWTARKPHESGAWQAVRAQHDRSITAVLAAIRAAWLASAPRVPAPRIY